jgi:integrase
VIHEPTITRVSRGGGRFAYVVRVWEDSERKPLGTFVHEEDALACKAAYLLEAAAAKPSSALTVEKWIATWLKECKADGKRSVGSSEAVFKAYVKGSKIGAMALRSVKPEHVREWIHGLKRRVATRGKNAPKLNEHGDIIVPGKRISDQTVRNGLHLLGAAFRDAIEAGKMRGPNPARGIRVEKQARTHELWYYLTLDEIRRLFALPELDSPRRRANGIPAVFAVAIYAGLREGELWGLHWEDVFLTDDPHVIVRYSYDGPTKNGIVRTVPLLPPAADALKAWRDYKGARKLKGLVWPGRPLARKPSVERHRGRGYNGGWNELRDAAGIRSEVVFHSLRHTYASHLVSGSWGRAWRLEEVQRLLGHAELKTTMRYAHLAPEAIRGAMIEARAMWITHGSLGPNSPKKKPRK